MDDLAKYITAVTTQVFRAIVLIKRAIVKVKRAIVEIKRAIAPRLGICAEVLKLRNCVVTLLLFY